MICYPVRSSAIILKIITASARCRQQGIAAGRATTPEIYASRSRMGFGILAPVTDSLLGFFEIYVGRPFRARSARDERVSEDEQRLVKLLQVPQLNTSSFWKAPSRYEPSPVLMIALRSTQDMFSRALAWHVLLHIMWALTLGTAARLGAVAQENVG